MPKFKTINEFFNLLVKIGPFCEKYAKGTDGAPLDPKRRLYHNLKGYDTAKKPVTDIHPDDKAALKEALPEFISDCQELYKNL